MADVTGKKDKYTIIKRVFTNAIWADRKGEKAMKRIKKIMIMLLIVLTVAAGGTAEAKAPKKNPEIFPSYFDVVIGRGKIKCTVKYLPKGAKVTWRSSNRKIAKVGKTGKVVAGKKEGRCKIIARIKTKGKTYDISATCICHKLRLLPPG